MILSWWGLTEFYSISKDCCWKTTSFLYLSALEKKGEKKEEKKEKKKKRKKKGEEKTEEKRKGIMLREKKKFIK